MVHPFFKLNLHKADIALLKKIQSFYGVGKIYESKANSAEYIVGSLKDLTDVIIPHFDKYPLMTQKRADFLLFKLIIELMNKKEHLTTDGLRKIVSLRASINNGLPLQLQTAFVDIKPVERPEVENFTETLDPY